MDNKLLWQNNINPLISNISEGIILYGAGLNTITFLGYLKHNQPEIKILCIVDADKTKQGNLLFNIPIISPEGLSRYNTKLCVVVTPNKNCLAITDMLSKLGFNNLFHYNGLNSTVLNSVISSNSFSVRYTCLISSTS